MAEAVTRPAVLVTGASGYLGGLIASRYVANTDFDVICHGRSHRRDQGYGSPDEPNTDNSRLHRVFGDLRDEDPFSELDEQWRRRVSHIVHAAAVTRFNVEQALAHAVNVEGTAKVVALAQRCSQLESFGLVSTVYSTGLRSGPIREEPYDDSAGFANHYEWSKWRAERLLVDGDGSLPWRVLRVATVVADDHSGHVTQYNAFHETLKLCFHGLLSMVPGQRDTPVYFITGGFAAEAVQQVMQHGRNAATYHVCHTRNESLVLQRFLDVVFSRFEAVEDFRRKGILRPLLADEESFQMMVEGVTAFGGSLMAQAVANVAPFARQLYVPKEVENSHLRAILPVYRAPDPIELVANTCGHLVETRWGRTSSVVA